MEYMHNLILFILSIYSEVQILEAARGGARFRSNRGSYYSSGSSSGSSVGTYIYIGVFIGGPLVIAAFIFIWGYVNKRCGNTSISSTSLSKVQLTKTPPKTDDSIKEKSNVPSSFEIKSKSSGNKVEPEKPGSELSLKEPPPYKEFDYKPRLPPSYSRRASEPAFPPAAYNYGYG